MWITTDCKLCTITFTIHRSTTTHNFCTCSSYLYWLHCAPTQNREEKINNGTKISWVFDPTTTDILIKSSKAGLLEIQKLTNSSNRLICCSWIKQSRFQVGYCYLKRLKNWIETWFRSNNHEYAECLNVSNFFNAMNLISL